MAFRSLLPAALLLSSFFSVSPVQALVPILNILERPNPDATAVCNALQKQYPTQVAQSGLDLNLTLAFDYTQARTDYWSGANADVKPACVFFPGSAEDVSFAVKTLNKFPGAPWAIKGGGHNANVGFSSTKGGVLIATHANMAYTTLDADNFAHVGPGCTGSDVLTALDKYGRTAVTGRLGVVGVAGLTLGGGLSFLSTQHGFAADNVVAYNVVLADGTIARASQTQNSDIW